MRYIIATLGCKVNQYESEAMDELLRAAGHAPAAPGEADAVLLNSCAVTAEGERKVRQALRRLRKENPDAVLCVCGCWSQLAPDAAQRLGAQVVFGTGDRRAFLDAAVAAAEERRAERRVADTRRRVPFEELPAGAYAGHARAYLKIEDGCDNFCAYCVIPYARGRVRSLPPERCAVQAAGLAGQGYREIVVTGIEIASYGKDLPGAPALTDALEAIAAAAPAARLHLGSLEPTCVTEDFCARLQGLSVCPHFHLSLQSGCDATLARMRRKYDTARFLRSVELLRAAFPGCGLTADLITGFPGETEEEFAATLAFLRRCAFSALHVFPYSVRPGTAAAALPGQVPREIRAARAAAAAALAAETERAYLGSCVGRTLAVLFETEAAGECRGHAENYKEVAVPGTALRGLVKNVKITGVRGKMLVGVAL